ncbi:dihydrofolate reductase family protein [Ornithinimicrobium tianjinense]|uniref:Bacterial bifunctional deaminase-reductase C-terminal domain-containing protein n=1 Tax=Ornithinimicrobium tianjinense TaxID=1195761 RepID=A0A917F3B9_9MICO|nr:dihydrofolate reductase family protein [Ornithinimicrobium tianjinense]GGF40968.1 hypothetical protein GCM10011366_05840 [Ornithinimicrobium tianjinense]
MQELTVDLIISLDGYASAADWPGLWGYWSAEYLAWLEEDPPTQVVTLMGAKTYRLMSSMAAGAAGSAQENEAMAPLTAGPKIVFSSTLTDPLSWANARRVDGDAAQEVRRLKEESDRPLRTLGSISLCRDLLLAGLVDRFRLVVFPVITGASGSERIFDGYPDVRLELLQSRTFEMGLQLLEYRPTVLDGPPGTA